MTTDTLIISKTRLSLFSHKQLLEFIENNKDVLIGGQLFSIGNTKFARLIQFITRKDAQSTFVPTHTGQIVLKGNNLVIVNVTPPKVVYVDLIRYIENTSEEYKIVYRGSNFKLDTNKYSRNVFNLVGKKYGWLSAIQSGFKFLRWIPNKKLHCSETAVKFLQEQGYFKNIKADDVTPAKLFHIMINGFF